MILEKMKSVGVVNTLVIAANVIVFLVMELLGSTEDSIFMLKYGASFAPLIFEKHEYWRLLTCMFLHFGMRHLFNNMFVLAFVGSRLEQMAGSLRYGMIYFGGGIISGIASALFDYWTDDFYISAGASGAVFAIVGAFAWIVIRYRGQIYDVSIRQIVLFVLFSIYLGFQGGGVDNIAHVSGLASGFLMGMLFCNRLRKRNSYQSQIF